MIRDISIVIPIYNEQDNIIKLIEVRASLEKINYKLLLLTMVQDNTYEVVNKIKKLKKYYLLAIKKIMGKVLVY